MQIYIFGKKLIIFQIILYLIKYLIFRRHIFVWSDLYLYLIQILNKFNDLSQIDEINEFLI